MAAHTLVVVLQHCHRAGCTYNCKRDTEPDISVISTDARARRTVAAARASVTCSARVPSGIRVRSSGRRCKAPPFFFSQFNGSFSFQIRKVELKMRKESIEL